MKVKNKVWIGIIYRCKDCGKRFHTLPAFNAHINNVDIYSPQLSMKLDEVK